MATAPQPENEDDEGLEIAVAQAIAARDGDMRATVRALIVENRILGKAISQAFLRGRFRTYAG